MTPNQIYALEPAQVKTCLYSLCDLLKDVDRYDIDWDLNGRVEARYYADHSFDGERCWSLYSLWFDDKPFMVCQEAGRGGRDHRDCFITDLDTCRAAEEYLRTLGRAGDGRQAVSPDEDAPALTSFYGCELSDFYTADLSPEFGPGDVVLAMVLEDHLRDRTKKVPTRVEIERVDRFSPRHTYHGRQLDRRLGTDHRMVDSPGNGNVWATFGESDVVGRAAPAP